MALRYIVILLLNITIKTNMFKIFKQVAKLEKTEEYQDKEIIILVTKITALEEHLGIEFFNGPTQKPHYRKLRVIKKKIGRPKKVAK